MARKSLISMGMTDATLMIIEDALAEGRLTTARTIAQNAGLAGDELTITIECAIDRVNHRAYVMGLSIPELV